MAQSYASIHFRSRLDRGKVRRQFVDVVLWDTHAEMHEWMKQNTEESAESESTTAAFCPQFVRSTVDWRGDMAVKFQSRLGTLMFVRGDWNIEIVMHEVLHAMFHSLRVSSPRMQELQWGLDDEEYEDQAEEIICFRAHHVFRSALGFLGAEDPQGYRRALRQQREIVNAIAGGNPS